MKGHWLWIVIAANLLVLLALAFVFPEFMVSPGALEPGHAHLSTDCFACHLPMRGARAERCVSCHALADIGLRTTKGTVLAANSSAGNGRLKLSFHQELAEQNCTACHSDHAGPKLARGSRIRFSHEILRAQSRELCESCHEAPKTELHRTFTGGCAKCHTSGAWRPATFDHDRHFSLTGDHNASCATCHVGNDYSKYTCYGCHEHTPDNVRRQHSEEGIRNFDNCVECHRGSGGESEGHGDREGGERQGRRERD
jgi:hypothetical protein